MRRALILAVAAVVLAAAPAAHAASSPSRFFGVMADGPLLSPSTNLDTQAALMQRSGVSFVRLAIYWADAEPLQGGPLQLGATDRVVATMARHGIAVLPVVLRAPPWARIDATDLGSPPRDPADFGAFLQKLVARYGRAGTLWRAHPSIEPLPIRTWEMWNEPEAGTFFTPGYHGNAWIEPYVALARAGHRALHAADPGATAVCAGLTNIKIWFDVRGLYAAGARPYCDAMAIHPFAPSVGQNMKVIRQTRLEMAAAGDARKPLLISEITASSGRGRVVGPFGWETDEAGQVRLVRRALTRLWAKRRAYHLLGVSWYTWMSPRPGSTSIFDYSGLLHAGDGARPVAKPALRAFAQTVRKLTSEAGR